MADNPIILLHPVREPLDQTVVGALELLARQTCFCGLFRFATTAPRQARSAAVWSITLTVSS